MTKERLRELIARWENGLKDDCEFCCESCGADYVELIAMARGLLIAMIEGEIQDEERRALLQGFAYTGNLQERKAELADVVNAAEVRRRSWD